MGKRIIQQRRGRGSHTYRVQDKAFKLRVGYPIDIEGEFNVSNIVPSMGHSVPIAKMMNNNGKTFNYFATNLLYVGQKINVGGENNGDVSRLGNLKNGTTVFNIEIRPGDGGIDKPILKAGKQYFIKRAKSKLWPRTSAIKMNKIDHPFGSGRGKRIKSKIAKRNAPPGKKVGLIRPRRTGRKKR